MLLLQDIQDLQIIYIKFHIKWLNQKLKKWNVFKINNVNSVNNC